MIFDRKIKPLNLSNNITLSVRCGLKNIHRNMQRLTSAPSIIKEYSVNLNSGKFYCNYGGRLDSKQQVSALKY